MRLLTLLCLALSSASAGQAVRLLAEALGADPPGATPDSEG